MEPLQDFLLLQWQKNLKNLKMNNLIIETFPVGPFQCNCSIVYDSQTKEALIVDPGDEGDKIIEKVEALGLKVKELLHTHAHLDHIGATDQVTKHFCAPARLHNDDIWLYENLPMQGNMFGLTLDQPDNPDSWISDEEEISFGSFKLKILHTPGHTPGSSCFFIEDAGSNEIPILFSGDTLFQHSIGRTDLWGGDFDLIKKSIKERLYTLHGESRVITGHGPDTHIHIEKSSNPFITA
jgi:glyoxylase-like metal-dependent hydrolase (beta-lactamase superfamily II)